MYVFPILRRKSTEVKASSVPRGEGESQTCAFRGTGGQGTHPEFTGAPGNLE